MSAVATHPTPVERAYATELTEKIRMRTARVGVLGLGYVGLPLAVEFSQIMPISAQGRHFIGA